ncbi:hypothetical protein BD410DRAFT_207416 [Rickenella mellea]|uniref:DUF6535 domain-containing protein n=1 Tax=Rickenella mellea TaxID=50990 RepID=A0A4Y7Q5W4_9AGAM|nr:hypothetical protein BD410DRAFT_207416 [Rickenella mellea]
MDSLLIFVSDRTCFLRLVSNVSRQAALFSASVTAFVIESYKTLFQDSGGVSVDVLLQISRQIANGTQATSAVRPTFQPDSTDIAINIFWFLSLSFSLACALAAVLVRQWACQYLRFPRSFSSTTEQASARQFLFENMAWWRMELVVETIPAPLHISLILFFIGLLLFARSISVTLAVYLLCFTMISGAAYAFITVTPLFFPGCPYKTPFSASVGLLVRIGKPPLKAIWIFITVSLASLVLLLSSSLYALIKLFLPSATIPKWNWESTQHIRSRFNRLVRHGRGTDFSLRGMRATIRESRLILVRLPFKVVALTTSVWTSSVSSLNRASLSVSTLVVERRRSFRNELSARDARALRWAVGFSKKDVDLLTILMSVPEIVQMHDSNKEIRLILWMSGITSQTHRLLRSSALIGSLVKTQSVLLACLETIIWSTQCSTHILEEENAWVDGGTSVIDDLLHDLSNGELSGGTFQWKPRISRLLNALVQIYSYVGPTFWKNLYWLWLRKYSGEITRYCRKVMAVLLISSKLHHDRASLTFRQAFRDLVDFMNRFSRMQNSRVEYCQVLRGFRVGWVSQLLNISFRDINSSSAFDATIWSSLCDSATHLLPFPFSTPDSQEGIFTLVNGSCRPVHAGQPLPVENLFDSKRADVMLTAYFQVLFGEADGQFEPFKSFRIPMNGNFISRVHVYRKEGPPFQKLGKIIEIPFDVYCSILDDLMSSIQMLPPEYQPPDPSSSIYFTTYKDLIAEAI